MDVNNRIRQFLKARKITIQTFEASIGKTNGYLSHTKSPTAGVLENISNVYSDLNLDWLITGRGEMFKGYSSLIGSNQGDSNKIEYNNAGNVGVGNTVNVALPESGNQKIIRPDGEVEIMNSNPNCKELDELKKENESLKSENSHFQSTMALKDDLIASLKDTIELLRHRQ